MAPAGLAEICAPGQAPPSTVEEKLGVSSLTFSGNKTPYRRCPQIECSGKTKFCVRSWHKAFGAVRLANHAVPARARPRPRLPAQRAGAPCLGRPYPWDVPCSICGTGASVAPCHLQQLPNGLLPPEPVFLKYFH